MEQSDLADHTVSFTSITMTPLTYLLRLLRLLEGKVTIHRYRLTSLNSLSDPAITALIGSSPPLAVLVCVGLGALTLGGVEDSTVFPTRGQIVKVHAPWVKSGYTRQVGSLRGGEGGERSYVIPRVDGEVILGGTREEGDREGAPREETGKDILRRTLEICPELVPTLPEDDDSPKTEEERLKELERMVVAVLVGFRPSRKGGTRLERGSDLYLSPRKGWEEPGEKTVVVYNYGHGGAGWQSSWGTAEDAVDVLLRSLAK